MSKPMLAALCLFLLMPDGRTACAAAGPARLADIDPDVLAVTAGGATVDVLVLLDEQADVREAARRGGARTVYDQLRQTAERTQADLRLHLDDLAVSWRPFWIVNAVAIAGADAAVVASVAAWPGVARIDVDPWVPVVPVSQRPGGARVVPWHVTQLGAPAVWVAGNTGQAAVVGILDTGCDWLHPALRDQYRGWDGASADHDHNWGDVTTTPGTPAPLDDHGHGTHLAGAAVGDDGQGMQIGVAPGARWIACRSFVGGWSAPSLMLAGMQWMLAPTPVAGGEGDPDRAPDVVTTAWYCQASQGCPWGVLLPAVAALRAAGIVVVASTGGGGPDCGTIVATPASFAEALTVGATGPGDVIAPFSGRGPVVTAQGTLVKPDVVAPGTNVLSTLPGGGYAVWSGTAMAAAQAAGVVALVVTALPMLAGDPDAIVQRLTSTAVPLPNDQCGDGDQIPNNVSGHGRLDAAAACGVLSAAPAVGQGAAVRLLPGAPNPFNPRTVLAFEVSRAADVDLSVVDARGRLVRVLVDGRRVVAGRHEVVWDGRDGRGRQVSAGVYFAVIRAAGRQEVGRLVLVR